jgi:hypothetical protein
LLVRAAELRAGGQSWEQTARKLDVSEEELRALAAAHPTEWAKRYHAARRELLSDGIAETMLVMRQQLRTADDKGVREAGGWFFRVWMNLYRHRTRPAKNAGKPDELAYDITQLDGMSEEEMTRRLLTVICPAGGWQEPPPDFGSGAVIDFPKDDSGGGSNGTPTHSPENGSHDYPGERHDEPRPDGRDPQNRLPAARGSDAGHRDGEDRRGGERLRAEPVQAASGQFRRGPRLGDRAGTGVAKNAAGTDADVLVERPVPVGDDPGAGRRRDVRRGQAGESHSFDWLHGRGNNL